MRFRVWGLKSSQLLAVGLLPLLFWCIFRWQDQPDLSLISFFHFYRSVFIVVGTVYFSFTLLWVFFMKRGLFTFRRALYLGVVLDFTYEIIQAVGSRNLGRIVLWMLLFVILAAVFRWLEKKIGSADLNPMVPWYEGLPSVIPRVFARIKVQDQWWDAGVRRADAQGLFVFLKDLPENRQSLLAFLTSERHLNFEIAFRELGVSGEGKISSVFWDQGAGIGLQFLPKDLYHFSQYTALVESLRGEGHA